MARAFIATIATFVVFAAQLFLPASIEWARALFVVGSLAATAGVLFQLLRPAEEAPIAVIDALAAFALLSQFPMMVDHVPQTLSVVFWLVLAPLGIVLMRLSPAFAALSDMSRALGWLALLVGAAIGLLGGVGVDLALQEEGRHWLIPFETIPRIDFFDMRLWPERGVQGSVSGRTHANLGLILVLQFGFSFLAALWNMIVMLIGVGIFLLLFNALVLVPLLGTAGIGAISDRRRGGNKDGNG
ncbi:hypothetical protein [Methylosinus sp. PW1]|uniref:hypothetical protein n=1 Tax=Methylosinus sp. PW1 TaxID=107636 RepID=UPI00055D68E1|nr:hypothetical protein [Methylosinus sp. PW1]